MKSSRIFSGLLLTALLWGASHALSAQPIQTPTPSPLPPPSQLIFCNFDTVFTIRADGSGRRTLVKRQFVASPSLSADGKRFAYDFYRDDFQQAETHIAPVDGQGGTSVVGKRTKDTKYLFPLLSPDGKSVLAQRRRLDSKGKISYSERLVLFGRDGGRRELGPDTLFAY